MRKTQYALMFLFIFFHLPVRPVESAVTTLDKSMRLYKAGRYDSTILVIREYLRRHGKDPQTELLVGPDRPVPP